MRNYFMRLSLLLFIFLLSCFGPIGPEQRVKSFYKDLSNASDIGELRDHFSSGVKPEDFELPIEPYQINKIKFIASNQKGPEKIFLTVDLEFKKNKDDIEVRKIVELIKVDDDWKIEKLENIKTYIEIDQSIDIKKPL